MKLYKKVLKLALVLSPVIFIWVLLLSPTYVQLLVLKSIVFGTIGLMYFLALGLLCLLIWDIVGWFKE